MSNNDLQDPPTILVVDDEPTLVEMLGYNLERAGYKVASAENGRKAAEMIRDKSPDLVILDIMMPELSGIDLLARLRADPKTAQLPVILLTAKAEEVDQIVGLTVGADDYVTKPYSPKVLIARVEALLRRRRNPESSQLSDDCLELGPIQIDSDTHEVRVDGQPIKLTLTEFKILTALVEGHGRVLSRSHLMSRAMGPSVTVTERTIDVHVTAIRKKLGEHAGMILTVRGVGYRAVRPSDIEAAEA